MKFLEIGNFHMPISALVSWALTKITCPAFFRNIQAFCNLCLQTFPNSSHRTFPVSSGQMQSVATPLFWYQFLMFRITFLSQRKNTQIWAHCFRNLIPLTVDGSKEAAAMRKNVGKAVHPKITRNRIGRGGSGRKTTFLVHSPVAPLSPSPSSNSMGTTELISTGIHQ